MQLEWACIWVCVAGACRAQNGFARHADASVADAIDRAAETARNPQLDLEARLAGYRTLMERYPVDPFVHRRFLAALTGYNKRPLYDQMVLPRYETLYRARPADPARTYLYALSIAWRDRKKSLELLAPLEGPWPQLALARFRPQSEKAAALANLEKFASLCPDTLDPEALSQIADAGSEALRKQTAERLRRQLAGRADAAALEAWPVLWQLEFQLVPASGHAELRKQVVGDVVRLREGGGPADLRLDAIRQGYRLAGDAVGQHWAQEELLRVAPGSRAAAEATIERWQDENPRPPRNATPQEQHEYYSRQLAAGEGWADRWPAYETAWQPRLVALWSLPDLPPERMAALGRSLVAAMERNPDFTFGFTDPVYLAVAERLAKAGVELPLALHAVDLGLQHSQQRLASDLAAGGGPMGAERIRGNTLIEEWLGRRIRIDVYLHRGAAGEARAELETYRKSVAAADAGDRLTLWRGLTGLVTAAIAADRKSVAREALERMSAALAEYPHSDVPREEIQRSLREAEYWKSKALLADADGRRADAAAYYRRGAEATPGDYNPQGRAELEAEARRVWTALGGSAEGLAALGGAAAQPSRWTADGAKMPGFSLQDMDGRTVRLEDLAGKTVFINVWATWCGPCQAELPYVQRIYDTLKERSGVRVLSFNIDDNPGVVSQFMKQHDFTFPAVLAREFVDEQMHVEAIPRNWIVDGRGVLRLERQAGADDTFVSDVLAAIDRTAGK